MAASSARAAPHPALDASADAVEHSGVAPPSVREALASPGDSLPTAARAEMESRFNRDFSSVRVHSDGAAAQSAHDIDARAYTVGSDVVFGPGEFSPGTRDGQRLIAHELAHVVQQSGSARRSAHLVAQREPKVKDKKTGPTIIYGGVILEGPAKDDLLKSQSVIPGEDNTHVYVDDTGHLGYEQDYKTPEDPFRWQKMKDCVDSKQKIIIRRIEKTDTFKQRMVSGKKVSDFDGSLPGAVLGLTMPTEAMQRKIYPGNTGTLIVSPDADTSYIYYTLLASKSASTGPLAHELFGHMWLALKGVPFGHPSKPDDIKKYGTIATKDGVLTPFGNPYAGTVREYIRDYAESQSIGTEDSSTLYVGPTLLDASLASFEQEFVSNRGVKGAMNGGVAWPGSIAELWGHLSRNFAILKLEPAAASGGSGSGSAASSPKSPRTSAELTASLTTWYGTLTPVKQYQFLKFIGKWITSHTALTELAADLNSLPKPKGMK